MHRSCNGTFGGAKRPNFDFLVILDVRNTNIKLVCTERFFLNSKKTSKTNKNKNQFFKIISRFRRDMIFLTPDSESASNSASYRTFRGIKKLFLIILEGKNRFRRKTGFCCSLNKERYSAKTDITIEFSILESTYHESLVGFFFDPE